MRRWAVQRGIKPDLRGVPGRNFRRRKRANHFGGISLQPVPGRALQRNRGPGFCQRLLAVFPWLRWSGSFWRGREQRRRVRSVLDGALLGHSGRDRVRGLRRRGFGDAQRLNVLHRVPSRLVFYKWGLLGVCAWELYR